APRGFGSCWFRCWHRSGSRSGAPAANGALTRGCRNGGHLLRGGDWATITLNYERVRVSVIVPTHNEAQSIALVLADLPSELTTEVIVVDSTSNDGPPEIPAKKGARVIQEPPRG